MLTSSCRLRFAIDPFGNSSQGFYISGRDVADEPYSGRTRPIRPASLTVSENMGNVTRLRNIIVWMHHYENTTQRSMNWQRTCSGNAYITSQRYTLYFDVVALLRVNLFGLYRRKREIERERERERERDAFRIMLASKQVFPWRSFTNRETHRSLLFTCAHNLFFENSFLILCTLVHKVTGYFFKILNYDFMKFKKIL